mgnify:FL=1
MLFRSILATRLAANGSRVAGWPSGGANVCRAQGDQNAPHVAVSNGEAVVVWNDSRTGNSGSGSGPALYAQRLTATGVIPVRPSNLVATHHDGQTFLTWVSPPDTGWTHRVYVTDGPITSDADFATAGFVGGVGDSSVFDRRLAAFSGIVRTFRTDSLAAPLVAEQGLFVVTPPSSRRVWYVVTSQLNGGPEDRHVDVGGNAVATAVIESLDPPRPVWQGTLPNVPGEPDLYTLWTTNVDTPLFPAMCNRPSWPFDCGVLHAAPGAPALVRPHQRGGNFMGMLVHSMTPNEWVLGLDDYTMNVDYQKIGRAHV